MRKRSLVLTFAVVFVLLNAGELFAQQGGQYRLGISYGSSIFSNKERFEFMIGGGRKIALTKDSPTAYFPATFSPGQAYSITQVSGPRTCTFFGQERGTFNSQDILITASCGNPPFSLFKLQVSGVGQGETFSFADNYGRRYSYPFSTAVTLESCFTAACT